MTEQEYKEKAGEIIGVLQGQGLGDAGECISMVLAFATYKAKFSKERAEEYFNYVHDRAAEIFEFNERMKRKSS